MTARRAISLHIERLVVDGLPLTATQAARLQASLERELARLIVERGDPRAWGNADAARRDAPPVVRWDTAHPHQLGRALAGGILTSLHEPVRHGAARRGRP